MQGIRREAMSISFEPGDGSFDIVLEHAEELPVEWNISGVQVHRRSADGQSMSVIKTYSEILRVI